MTVENQTFKVEGLGNDSATVFSFDPMVLPEKNADLTVTLVTAAGVETLLVEGTGDSKYAVTVASFPGSGSVTYPEDAVTPIATGVSIIMKRVLVLENQTDLENQGGYHADTQELSIDRLTMIDLQQQDDLNRAIKIQVSTSGVTTELPEPVALHYLRWDSAATAIEAVANSTTTALASDVVPLAVDLTAAAAGVAADFSREDHRHLWGGLSTDTTPQLGGFLDVNGNAIEFEMGAAIASVAGDTAIWAGQDGNIIHITGTNAITDFGTPNQAGQMMWLIFDAAASVVDSATITVEGNANYTAVANDMALVVALTTSTFQFIPFPNAGLTWNTREVADGTDGEIPTWDASGFPATVAVGTSGDVLTSGGAGAAPTFVTVAGTFKSMQVFTGDGTWTKPAGITLVLVKLVGGGGAGGGASGSASATAVGGGGGGGGYVEAALDVTSIANSTITRGAGATGDGDGGATGENTVWSDGTNTLTGSGGVGGAGDGTAPAGGAGGAAAGGDVNLAGQTGGGGQQNEPFGASGAGGGTVMGPGAPGAFDLDGAIVGTAAVDGMGGGGGGAVSASVTTARNGGDGGNGIVIVYEYG